MCLCQSRTGPISIGAVAEGVVGVTSPIHWTSTVLRRRDMPTNEPIRVQRRTRRRPTGRRSGPISNRSPIVPEMNPGTMQRNPAIESMAASSISPPGVSPRFTDSRVRRITPRPSRFTSHTPTALIAMRAAIVGRTPIQPATATTTPSSISGNTTNTQNRNKNTSEAYR